MIRYRMLAVLNAAFWITMALEKVVPGVGQDRVGQLTKDYLPRLGLDPAWGGLLLLGLAVPEILAAGLALMGVVQGQGRQWLERSLLVALSIMTLFVVCDGIAGQGQMLRSHLSYAAIFAVQLAVASFLARSEDA